MAFGVAFFVGAFLNVLVVSRVVLAIWNAIRPPPKHRIRRRDAISVLITTPIAVGLATWGGADADFDPDNSAAYLFAGALLFVLVLALRQTVSAETPK